MEIKKKKEEEEGKTVRREKRKGGKEGEKKEKRRHSKGREKRRGQEKRGEKEKKRGLHFQPCAHWAGLESPWVEKSQLCKLIHFHFLLLCTFFPWFVLVIY